MDHQQHPTQLQAPGQEPNYYAPPAEKMASTNAGQYGGNYATYPVPQYQTQPADAQGAMGSQYPVIGSAHGSSNEGYKGDAGYGGAVTSGSSQPVLGIKRTIFFSMLASLVILLALVIGLGAGLGVSQNKLHNTQTDLSRAQASLLAAIGSSDGQPTGSGTATASATGTATSTTSLPTSNILCPSNNNTEYIASNGKKFQEMCGIDYVKDGGADLANTKAISMDACMDACSKTKGCQGAGWGYIQGDKSLNHTCYMKTNLTKPSGADPGWAFGLLFS